MRRYDLMRLPMVRWMLISRWPQLVIRAVLLGMFVFVILAGWFGTPVGSRNFGIIGVWIGWWALLILLAVPLLGRGWCNICPIPMPGEWLQNGAVLGPPEGGMRRGGVRRWPRALRGTWLQSGAFVLLALFSAVVLTQPRVTAVLLALLLVVAIGTSMLFERRSFCRHLCPVGGFIGLYSQLSPVEVRVKDTAICARHTEKTCYLGSRDGYGCPWNVFPGGMVKNTYCGMCMECLRTCPLDNIAVNLRPCGADLAEPRGRKLDEAFKALIMVASAVVYSAVMLGPWSWLKTAAYSIGSTRWLGYALLFLLVTLGVVPGLFYLATWSGKMLSGSVLTVRQSFVRFAYSLVPLGLAAWIGFSLSFVFANWSYVWPVLSDPMGWGWNLFGTSDVQWTPYFTGVLPLLQVLVLLGGLAWAGTVTRRLATEGGSSRQAVQQALPVMLFHFLITVGMLWLLIG